MADSQAENSGKPDESGSGRRRTRIIKNLFMFAICCSLPLTILVLWLLAYVQMWPHDVDISGLLAISIGILGILIFFMFLYKYQMIIAQSIRRRWLLLAMHALVTLVLFLFTIWLGYDSPWADELIWGSYDMLASAKPWIISVLVIGSITLLGSLFDLMRRRFDERWKENAKM